MDIRRLVELRCPEPSCAGSLQLEPKAIRPRFAPVAHSCELMEGVVRCDQCLAEYPVVAGVLIVHEDMKTYVSAHYSLLLTCAAAEGVLGPDMLQYLRSNGYDLIELNRRDYSYAHQSLYLSAHYDDLGRAAAQMGGPFGDYLGTHYENIYDLLLQELKGLLDQNHVALDLGCNVGGMAYRLAPHCGFVFGVDESYAATLTARKLLLQHPTALNSYRLRTEGRGYEERALALARPDNAEFLVASGIHLPFPPEFFDLVTCLSVIDCVPDPAHLLRSITGSLKPDGILLINDPYSWTVDSTNVSKWLGEDTGGASAPALRTLLAERFEIIWEQDAVPWILREHARFYQVWLNHCLVARKRGGCGR